MRSDNSVESCGTPSRLNIFHSNPQSLNCLNVSITTSLRYHAITGDGLATGRGGESESKHHKIHYY